MKYIPQKNLSSYRKDNEPTLCPLLNCTNNNWVVDHCHKTGQIRGVVSSEGNVLLGKIENAYSRLSAHSKGCSLSVVLRSIADYLEKPSSGLLHPVGYRQLYKRFKNFNKDFQLDILLKLGINRQRISECKNSKDRTNLYKEYIKQ
jgi:hypothetical protein